jgi:hypothetical protein
MHRLLPLLVIGMFFVVPAAAQQSRPPVPETFRSLLENEQVNVKEMRLRPGAKLPPATYPNSFIYGLTDGSIVYTLPGKTPFEISFRAGEAVWIPSQLAATANETDKEVRVLVVEIKAKPPAAARSKKAGGKPAKKKK